MITEADVKSKPTEISSSYISHSRPPSPTTAEGMQGYMEKKDFIKVLKSARPTNAKFLETKEDEKEPYWWPYSQNILFAENEQIEQISMSLSSTYCLTWWHTTVMLKDLEQPNNYRVNREYLKALMSDIMERRSLMPHHGFITIRAANCHIPVDESLALPSYEVSDGFPLLFALYDLSIMGYILDIGRMPLATTGFTIGGREPLDGHELETMIAHASLSAVIMPTQSSLDEVYANKLTRWITRNPFVPFDTYGRIIALQKCRGKYEVIQGMPLLDALRKAKDKLEGDETSIPITVVNLVSKKCSTS